MKIWRSAVGLAVVAAVCMLLLAGLSDARPVDEGSVSPDVLTRVAFGSCSKHDRPQPLWPHIVQFDPDLWIWLGDVVYADTRHFPFSWTPSPLEEMKAKYDAQKALPAYRNFSVSTPIVGTWDDHDYGINNGGSAYVEREQSKRLFLDFFDEPLTSARWTRSGVYGAYTFGPVGRRVQVLLLDVRYNRDDPALPNRDILGDEQWRWLERTLAESDAQLHLIGSGIQVLPRDKPIQEKWANFPRSLARLERALSLAKGTVVLLSGDVHYAEIFKSRPRCGEEARDYEGIYEITSSGMTHCLHDHFPLGFGSELFNAVMGSKWRVSDLYPKRNFGTVEIAWAEDGRPTSIRLAIRNETGDVALEQNIIVGAKGNDEHRCLGEDELRKYTKAEGWMNWHSDVWIDAMNYAILASPVLLVALLAWCCLGGGGRRGASSASQQKKTSKKTNNKTPVAKDKKKQQQKKKTN